MAQLESIKNLVGNHDLQNKLNENLRKLASLPTKINLFRGIDLCLKGFAFLLDEYVYNYVYITYMKFLGSLYIVTTSHQNYAFCLESWCDARTKDLITACFHADKI